MSSTLRLFLNDNRISTAVRVKSGSILQTYPARTTFLDEVAWREHWDLQMKPKIILKISYPSDSEKEEEEELPAPAPAPAPVSVAVAPVKKTGSLNDWKVTKKERFTHTLPAGKYYIGDLCYVLGNDVYRNVFGGTGYSAGIYEEKQTDRTFLVTQTAYGDGEFLATDGKKFAVDAAIIGICPVSLMAKDDGGGHVYTFDKPVTCDFKVGRFTFTSGYTYFHIDTEGEEEY